jgi:hypothetical protein
MLTAVTPPLPPIGAAVKIIASLAEDRSSGPQFASMSFNQAFIVVPRRNCFGTGSETKCHQLATEMRNERK